MISPFRHHSTNFMHYELLSSRKENKSFHESYADTHGHYIPLRGNLSYHYFGQQTAWRHLRGTAISSILPCISADVMMPLGWRARKDLDRLDFVGDNLWEAAVVVEGGMARALVGGIGMGTGHGGLRTSQMWTCTEDVVVWVCRESWMALPLPLGFLFVIVYLPELSPLPWQGCIAWHLSSNICSNNFKSAGLDITIVHVEIECLWGLVHFPPVKATAKSSPHHYDLRTASWIMPGSCVLSIDSTVHVMSSPLFMSFLPVHLFLQTGSYHPLFPPEMLTAVSRFPPKSFSHHTPLHIHYRKFKSNVLCILSFHLHSIAMSPSSVASDDSANDVS